ncbi:RmlC-like cupin domain-containing protein [Auriculariales sp. MPI-PUGE-AT-0066]|nr:RmlC-like cupin domain-containing protein [Auriculariales sp. MPI-PUGE-AT-0066]
MSTSRSVVKTVLAIEQSEGAGARVHRSIGSARLRNLSPFLMLDHFKVPQGGFPDHPHRGQATVTYMLQGAFQHEDSVGHAGTIEAGGVQWMTAGKGIIHAEMPVLGEGYPTPIGLQLWIDLPKEHKLTQPTYQELSKAGIPSAWPEGEDGPVEIRIISGDSHGVSSPVKPLGGCWYFHFVIKEQGKQVFQPIPKGWTTFLYIFKGSVIVNPKDERQAHESHNTLVLSAEETEDGVALEAGSDGTEFVLIAGEPLDQTVFQHGPFVMTDREGIMQTIKDYQLGQNGFENAHTWRSKIGDQ